MTANDYIRDGTAIYEKSFAIIRAEADLQRFADDEADLAVRMIHAAGLVEAAPHFVFSPGFVTAAWIMRTATSDSSSEKRERSASARMIAKDFS